MKIIPITLKLANAYVEDNHRHHKAVTGCKFCIGLLQDNELVGVAICGRPVSRHYDDGLTLEINRLCTDGTRNACSKLYGACVRIAVAMGYERIITYTLQSENGASLKASNFVCEGIAGGEHWTGARNRETGVPKEMKIRWAYYRNASGEYIDGVFKPKNGLGYRELQYKIGVNLELSEQLNLFESEAK